jgi:hypothetical protein
MPVAVEVVDGGGCGPERSGEEDRDGYVRRPHARPHPSRSSPCEPRLVSARFVTRRPVGEVFELGQGQLWEFICDEKQAEWLENASRTMPPSEKTTAVMTAAIAAIIRPYSTAEAPSSR